MNSLYRKLLLNFLFELVHVLPEVVQGIHNELIHFAELILKFFLVMLNLFFVKLFSLKLLTMFLLQVIDAVVYLLKHLNHDDDQIVLLDA